MRTLYETLSSLCADRGIKPGKMCADLGFSRSTVSDLKMGRKKTLSSEYLAKISNYFGVSVDYLLGNETEKAPTLTKKDERDIARQLETLSQSLESGEGLMFDGDPLSDEARESILQAMKLGLEAAKLRNKEKYTPKKYKKG
ncbi:XRE family transcriptional regulator [Neobittarella massiliensis]|uniref:XRE family transcriptional regulator n=1 Tax=Neobittarella massiliensis (ex Bilen et al. 2018) TaxID=2041842 RepID=A0A8J6M005_9FIRM|nr:XRE family transcriptional regulator [Neobittarella massiliensis]MBC3517188.1 XRE family transcriptional regulator [Neobittarella massiliensis]